MRRNVVINLSGQLVAVMFGAVAIPNLIRLIGLERFGILSLSWVILGSLGLVDLGLARATTKIAADAMAVGERAWLGSIVRTSVVMHAAIGVGLGLALVLLRGRIASQLLNPSPPLLDDAGATLALLAIALPFVTTGNGARSVIEAAQRFDLVNAVGIPSSALTYLLPVLGAVAGVPLPGLVLLLLLNRCAVAVTYSALALAIVPEATGRMFPRSAARALFRFGGWVALSNAAAPVLVYGDRVIASAILGVAAVGYYAPPADAITRLWVIPAATAAVIFPALSALAARGDSRYPLVAARALGDILTVAGPVLFAAALVSTELMTAWLGSAVGGKAAELFRLLAIGTLAGALGYFPAITMQAIGRPELTAKVQLAQLVPFLALAAYLVGRFGLVGAAIAWTTRTIADLLVGLLVAHRLGGTRLASDRTMTLIAVSLVVIWVLGTPAVQGVPFVGRIAAAVFCVLLAGAAALRSWRRMIQIER